MWAIACFYLQTCLRTIFYNGSMFSVSVFFSKDVSWVSIMKINIYSFLLLSVWTLKFFVKNDKSNKLMQNLRWSTVFHIITYSLLTILYQSFFIYNLVTFLFFICHVSDKYFDFIKEEMVNVFSMRTKNIPKIIVLLLINAIILYIFYINTSAVLFKAILFITVELLARNFKSLHMKYLTDKEILSEEEIRSYSIYLSVFLMIVYSAIHNFLDGSLSSFEEEYFSLTHLLVYFSILTCFAIRINVLQENTEEPGKREGFIQKNLNSLSIFALYVGLGTLTNFFDRFIFIITIAMFLLMMTCFFILHLINQDSAPQQQAVGSNSNEEAGILEGPSPSDVPQISRSQFFRSEDWKFLLYLSFKASLSIFTMMISFFTNSLVAALISTKIFLTILSETIKFALGSGKEVTEPGFRYLNITSLVDYAQTLLEVLLCLVVLFETFLKVFLYDSKTNPKLMLWVLMILVAVNNIETLIKSRFLESLLSPAKFRTFFRAMQSNLAQEPKDSENFVKKHTSLTTVEEENEEEKILQSESGLDSNNKKRIKIIWMELVIQARRLYKKIDRNSSGRLSELMALIVLVLGSRYSLAFPEILAAIILSCFFIKQKLIELQNNLKKQCLQNALCLPETMETMIKEILDVKGVENCYDVQIFQNTDLKDDNYISLSVSANENTETKQLRNEIDVIIKRTAITSKTFIQFEFPSMEIPKDSLDLKN